MNKKRLGFFLLAGLLLASALVFLPAVKDGVMAETTVGGDGIELRGWSWSSNTGWISFNSKDLATPTNNYAVTMSSTTGALSGYAWSSNLGWIKFDPSLSGPSGNDTPYGAKLVDPDLKGWARACSVFVGGCTGTLKPDTERGGWDGWIEMVNVRLATNDSGGKYFSGYAWGDLNLGWIHLGGDQDNPPDSCTEDIDTDCKNGPDCCSSEGPCVVDCGGTTKTLTCSVTGNDENDDLNTEYIWEAVYSGNETPLSYVWSGSPPINLQTTNPTPAFNYPSIGVKTGHVAVKSGGVTLKETDCSTSVTVGEVHPCTLNPGDPVVAAGECCINGITPPIGELCPATSCNITITGSNHMTYWGEDGFSKKVKISLSSGCSASSMTLSSNPLNFGSSKFNLACFSASGSSISCSGVTSGDMLVGARPLDSLDLPGQNISESLQLILKDAISGDTIETLPGIIFDYNSGSST